MDPSVLTTPAVREPGPASAFKTGLTGHGALPPKKKDVIADWAKPNSKFMTAPEHQPPKDDKPLKILRIMYSPAAVSKASTSSGDDSTPEERLVIRNTRTTCLLCSDPLLLESVIKSEGGESSGEKTGPDELIASPAHQNQFRAVKDLCRHLKINPKDVPDQYSEDMLPFCGPCQDLVEKISQSYNAIQEESRKIDENILAIGHRVADAELSGNSWVCFGDKDEKFLKLREVILNGYRRKLMIKKKDRESQLLEDSVHLDERQCRPGPTAHYRTVVLPHQDLWNQLVVHANKTKLDDSEGSAMSSQKASPPNSGLVDSASQEVESKSSESGNVDGVTYTDTEIPDTENGHSAANGANEENDDKTLIEDDIPMQIKISNVRSLWLEDSRETPK